MSGKILESKRAYAYALLLINTILWGLAAPLIKRSLDFVSPNTFLFGRYLLASALFLPLYFFWAKKPLKTNNWWLLIFLALLGTPITLIPLYEGLKLTTSLEASILTAVGPITTIIGGAIFLKEVIARNEKIGVTIAFLGSLLIIFEPLLTGANHQGTVSIIGGLLILLSNLIWTAFLLLAKRVKTDSSLLSLTSYLISIPVFGLLVLAEGQPFPAITRAAFSSFAWIGIAYMAIFGSIIAFWTYIKAQEYIEASEAAVFTYLQPLFTFPLAFFWLKEPFTPFLAIACLVIAAGVYLSERRK